MADDLVAHAAVVVLVPNAATAARVRQRLGDLDLVVVQVFVAIDVHHLPAWRQLMEAAIPDGHRPPLLSGCGNMRAAGPGASSAVLTRSGEGTLRALAPNRRRHGNNNPAHELSRILTNDSALVRAPATESEAKHDGHNRRAFFRTTGVIRLHSYEFVWGVAVGI